MIDATGALATSYVRFIAELLERLDVPLEHWLGLSGLDRRQLADDGFVVDLATFRTLSLDAQRLSGEPALGLLVGDRLGAEAHGALGHAAMSSRTIREVLGVVQRYLGLRIALLALSVEPGRYEVRVVLRELLPLGDIRAIVLEGVLSSIRSLLMDASRGACAIQRVAFPYADPGYAEQARALLQCPVRYGQDWAGLVLSPAVLDVPLRMSDPRAFGLADELCRRELRLLEQARSWAARVQRVLLETRVGFPSQQETAERLHLTPRTLHRRLVAEGTSFRALLADVRHRSAVDQLLGGDASIAEIAYILGYSDEANFRRAFRGWEGMPPSVFRRVRVSAPASPPHRSTVRP